MSGAGRGGRAWRAAAALALAAAGVALGGWGLLRAQEADPGAYVPVSLAEVEGGKPLPALVAVRGRVVTEAAVRFGPEDRLRFWFPLVSESWAPGAPVGALVLDPGGPALAGVTFRARLQGSRVPAPVREALAARGISLAARVRVLDAARADRADSRRGWLAAGAGAALIAAAVALALRRP